MMMSNTGDDRSVFVRGISIVVALITTACSAPELEQGSVSESELVANVHDVWTHHYDNQRTGATLNETVLNTSNVNVSTFGKLFTRSVDDQIYAQPLYLAGVPIAGGSHNVVYVATVANTVYAFDADDPAASMPLARRSLLDIAAAGARPVKNADVGQACGSYLDFAGNLGIVGTPVIDRASGTLYLVSRVKEPAGFVQRLHALDVTTLGDRPGSPLIITASVPGTGDGSVAGRIAFDPQTENQRPAVLLSNGVVYIAWASQCDTGPYHGWVLGYDAASLAQTFVFNDTPDGAAGGIWQAGQGLSADSTGKLYVITGNGTASVRTGGQSYGNAFVKLDPTLASPVLDWFMPFNVDDLNAADDDLGASGALLIPGTQLLVGGGKEGKLYLLDRNAMGHFQAGSDSQIVQSFPATLGHIHSSPVYWNSQTVGQMVYVWSEKDFLRAFSFSGTGFNTVPSTSAVKVPEGMPGGMLAISANGNAAGSGIVWAGHPSSGDANHATQPGLLRALDAENVGHELWNSNINGARDGLGNFAKFVPPVVANGKVYLATFSFELCVYGLLQSVNVPSPGDGTGLAAEYFDNIDLSNKKVSRNDATVNFNWGAGSPDAAIAADTFSARWTGQVLPPFSETYTFITTSDDGVRLWVNGALIIDAWSNHGSRDDRGTITLVAGQRYDLKMEYYEDGGDAVARLAWSSPSLAPQIIPASQLFPASSATGAGGAGSAGASGTGGSGGGSGGGTGATGNGTGLRAQYFDNIDFTGTAITRTDPNVSFEWGTGSPDPAIGPDTFSARWTGQISPRFSETYTFTTTSDDGIRLWLNGVLVIDNFTDHARVDNSGTISLVAGQKYDLRLEYYENGGGALALLAWASPSQTQQIVPQSQLFPAAEIGGTGGAGAGGAAGTGGATGTGAGGSAGAGTGTGLLGQYFDNVDFTGTQVTRIDPSIGFDWGAGSPIAGIGADTFSVRWTGQIQARFSETYTFTTTSDDGVRLWLDNVLVIDNFTNHARLDNTGNIALVAGQKYDLKLEYYESTGQAVAMLAWSSPSQPRQIVPQSQLFAPSVGASADAGAVASGTGLTGEYFDNLDLTNLIFTRTDPSINFDWVWGSPDPRIAVDTFSVRWTGQVVPRFSETYTFTTTSDDGVRLWVNGTRIIDHWTDHALATDTGTITLSANQMVAVRMEFYDATLNAVASLAWSSASQPPQLIPTSQLFPQ